jgi:hypothetical protein
MVAKFPTFSQALAQDPTTRRLWFGIATAHDFESHDEMTEERFYQKIFASHFGQLAIIFSGHLEIFSMSLGKETLRLGSKIHFMFVPLLMRFGTPILDNLLWNRIHVVVLKVQ